MRISTGVFFLALGAMAAAADVAGSQDSGLDARDPVHKHHHQGHPSNGCKDGLCYYKCTDENTLDKSGTRLKQGDKFCRIASSDARDDAKSCHSSDDCPVSGQCVTSGHKHGGCSA